MSLYLLRLLVLLGLLLPGAAGAQGLFVDPPSSRIMADPTPDARIPGTVKRSRLVGLDTAYLASRVLGDPVSPAAGISLPPIFLPLFADLPVTVQVTAREVTADGRLVWRGQPEGVTGFVNLVISGIQITGQVQVGDQVIEIRPASFGLHRIIEIDQSFFPREGDAGHAPAPDRRSAAFRARLRHDRTACHRRLGHPRAVLGHRRLLYFAAHPAWN